MLRPFRLDTALGWAVTACALSAVAGIGALDLVVGLPASGAGSTISAYVYTSGAWAFHLCIALLAVGSTALLVGLVRQGRCRPRSGTAVMLAVSVLSLVAILVFPKTDWAVGDSPAGRIHRMASLLAFLLPPIATLRLTRSPARAEHRAARGAHAFAVTCLAVLGGVVVLVFAFASQGRHWWRAFPLGAVERTTVLCELLAMALLGVWVATTARAEAALTVPPEGAGSRDRDRPTTSSVAHARD